MPSQSNLTAQHDLAERIRSATAWWHEAARALDEGRPEDAANCAALGQFGLDGVRRDLDAETATA